MSHRLKMGVPDDVEGPPRKKLKLSLGTKRKEQSHPPAWTDSPSSGLTLSHPAVKESNESAAYAASVERSTSDNFNLMAESPPPPEPPVAPVASLHNLGNTCFLNSILQILRYTPKFLSGLAALKEDITALEDALEKIEDDNTESLLSLDTQRTWRFVKDLHWMYHRMDQREVWYSKTPTSDSSQMGVRPSTVLNSIRELNPMFEGNFQHDAQELLRCLLCYMEDAEKDVKKMKSKVLLQDDANMGRSSISSKDKTTKSSTECSTDVSEIGSEKAGASKDSDERNPNRVKKIGAEKEAESLDAVNRGEPSKFEFKLKGGAPPSRTSRRRMVAAKENCDVASAVQSDENREKTIANGHVAAVLKAKEAVVWDIDRVREGDKGQSLPAKITKGTKRKRSRSRSANVQSNGDDCVDGGDLTESLPAGAKHEAEPTPLASVLRKGTAATKKKFEGNGQTIVGFLKKVKEKLVSGPNHVSEQPIVNQNGTVEATEAAISNQSEPRCTSKLPSKQVKRMGMTGFVFRQSKPPKEKSDLTADKADTTGQGVSDCIVIEDDEDFDSFPSTSSSKGQVGKYEECHNESTLEKLNAQSQTLNHITRPIYRSPVFSSPMRSPKLINADDEITLASENDVPLDIESTINAVTKKYYSSLSRPGLGHGSPAQSPGKSSSLRSYDDRNVCESDMHTKCSEESQQKDAASQSIGSPNMVSLTPGKDLIIHSPSKANRKCVAKSSCKKSKVVKAIDFGSIDENIPFSSQAESPVLKPSDGASDGNVNVLDFLPKNARQVSESQPSQELWNNLLNLDDSGIKTRSTRSAPNSPALNPCTTRSSHTSTSAKLEVLSKSSGRDPLGSLSFMEARNITGVKIELKRCDWLGVSPVKSVSAASALRNLSQREKQPVHLAGYGFLGVKRNILGDIDPQASSRKKCLSQGTGEESADHAMPNLQCNVNETHHLADSNKNVLLSQNCDIKSDVSLQNGSNLRSSSMGTKRCPVSPENALFSSMTSHTLKDCSFVPRKAADEPCDRNVCRSEESSKSSDSSVAIHYPSGLKLKPLSISVDKCDWMLSSLKPCPAGSHPLGSVHRSRMVNGKVKAKRVRSKAGGVSSHMVNPLSSHQEIVHPQVLKIEENSTSPLIERLFGGTMVHLTRCLECERSRDRKETFLDISIAVKHLKAADADDSLGEEEEDAPSQKTTSSSCLASLIHSSSSVERLRDSNKYWCEECLHHVEAERSCHYLDLPQVLSLHLKRFSTNSGLFGGLSKLNDKVDIPEELPCLRHQCGGSCRDRSHRYQLFALATHSGTSILHGHYRSYVKVQQSVSSSVFHNLVLYHKGSDLSCEASKAWAPGPSLLSSFSNCTAPASMSSSPSISHQPQQDEPISSAKEGLLCPVESKDSYGCGGEQEFIPSSSSILSSQKNPLTIDAARKEGAGLSPRRITDFFASTKIDKEEPGDEDGSSDCYIVSSSQKSTCSSAAMADSYHTSCVSQNSSGNKGNNSLVHSGCFSIKNEDLSVKSVQDSCIGITEAKETDDSKSPSCFWLECDDECVRVIDEEEFGQKLREEDGALLGVPYLLFYHSQGMAVS